WQGRRDASPLFAGPGAARLAGRLVVPGGGLGVGDGVEDRPFGLPLWGVGSGGGHELEEPRGVARAVHGEGVEARLALGDPERPALGRRAKRREGVEDDLLDRARAGRWGWGGR